ncbi:MAG: bifunctional diaminohydroxyphosphoribosylaminopyrimidine deaminase/5-amino-6-(5-phosphoribosylamino)uracil reductase RibD [Cyclobacteriaceae bacterium]
MHRALQLAKLGLGRVSPNPMVGCVIVKNNKIIGEGNHEKYGEGHAEVNAVYAIKDKSDLAGSTVYVTLEPCAHFGKTPPCAHLLVDSKVKEVVICNHDPNPLVAGKGVKILEEAGIKVFSGVLQEEGKKLNRRFLTFFNKERPYVILKWAQTADGFVARENFDSKWISNTSARQLVHKWRAEEQAILVGTNTAKHDNPSLTTRNWSGSNPVRIVLDRNLCLESSLNLFDGAVRTIVFNELENKTSHNLEYIKLPVLSPFLILKALFERKIQSVFIEGGSATLQSFIDADLWDEARVFESQTTFSAGVKSPFLKDQPTETFTVDTNVLKIYQNNR